MHKPGTSDRPNPPLYAVDTVLEACAASPCQSLPGALTTSRDGRDVSIALPWLAFSWQISVHGMCLGDEIGDVHRHFINLG